MNLQANSMLILAFVAFCIALILTRWFLHHDRKKGQNKRRKIEDFIFKVNRGLIVLYSNNSSNKHLLDKDGSPITLLDGIKGISDYKIVYKSICAGSQLPSKAYRVAIDNYYFLPTPQGILTNFLVLEVCPMNRIGHKWNLVSQNDQYIVAEDAIMGTIIIENREQVKNLKTTIILEQSSTKLINIDSYCLEYQPR